MPLIASLTCADCCIVANHICIMSHLEHRKQCQCVLPFAPLLTGTDGSIVANNIWIYVCLGHIEKQGQCLLPLTSFLARANGRAVDNHICTKLCCGHCLEKDHCMLRLAAFPHLTNEGKNCVYSQYRFRFRSAVQHETGYVPFSAFCAK